MNRAELITKVAKSYVGKTEKQANSGFNDPAFEKKMKQVGWIKSQAWCSFLVELIWKEGYADKPDMVRILDRLCSGAATATFKNFDLNPAFETSKTPKPGAIAIWRHGNSWQGHAGVVHRIINENNFVCIEGNTNDKGGREGYIVAEKVRLVKHTFLANGLNLVGFIYPVED